MVVNRKDEIENLKKEFPPVASKGLWPTVFTLPVNVFFGTSSCILEITIPRTYPSAPVSFKLINPIPHEWAYGDLIKYPAYLKNKPIVDIVWEVISGFYDYKKYCTRDTQGITKPTNKAGTIAKLSDNIVSTDTHDVGHKPIKGEIDPRILKAINNPPKGAIPEILEMTDEQVDQYLKDGNVNKIIYNTTNFFEAVNDVKSIIKENEELITKTMGTINKHEELSDSIKKKVDAINQINFPYISKKMGTYKESLTTQIKTNVERLEQELLKNKKLIEDGALTFEESRSDVHKLYSRINKLSILYVSLKN